MNELAKKSDLENLEREFAPLLEAFRKKLADPIDPKIVKKLRGIKYVPIEVIEQRLDTIYNGLWSVENLHYSVEINSVVVSLDLKVFHPVARVWMTRSGIASIPVQVDAGDKSANPIPKPTALQKNMPAAKAIAVKNAAQSLGRHFGRNLNRSWDVPHKDTESVFDDVKI